MNQHHAETGAAFSGKPAEESSIWHQRTQMSEPSQLAGWNLLNLTHPVTLTCKGWGANTSQPVGTFKGRWAGKQRNI